MCFCVRVVIICHRTVEARVQLETTFVVRTARTGKIPTNMSPFDGRWKRVSASNVDAIIKLAGKCL